jgi:hypothetical protein
MVGDGVARVGLGGEEPQPLRHRQRPRHRQYHERQLLVYKVQFLRQHEARVELQLCVIGLVWHNVAP